MQPYIVRRGDHLLSVAYQFGFDADMVWNDPKNATLRQLRPDPNILYPTDVLYIPDQNVDPTMNSLSTGTTNAFVSTPPTITVTHKFVSDDASAYASKAYTIEELDQLTGLTTDGSGALTFQAPVTLSTATIVFSDTGESCALSIGLLDPINTLSGIFQRLQNLGYLCGDLQLDSSNLAPVRIGLRSLKASQSSSGTAPASSSEPESPSAPDPGPASSPAPASDPGDGSSAPSDSASTNGSEDWPEPLPASTPSPGDPSASSPTGPADNAGLTDDGTLDDDTSALLLQVYGF